MVAHASVVHFLLRSEYGKPAPGLTCSSSQALFTRLPVASPQRVAASAAPLCCCQPATCDLSVVLPPAVQYSGASEVACCLLPRLYLVSMSTLESLKMVALKKSTRDIDGSYGALRGG